MEDEHLPEHTISMRKVCDFCESAWKEDSLKGSSRQSLTNHTSQHSIIESHRQSSLDQFKRADEYKVDVISDLSAISPQQFRRDYQQANRPCLIEDGPLLRQHFSKARELWVGVGGIRRTWFRSFLEGETLPVRCQETSIEDVVDDEGRAVECETRGMSVKEWFELLDVDESGSFYLKDWHLQKWLQSNRPEMDPLYEVPPHFQHDLLNRMCQFTDGDYHFVYWGPTGSRTGLHSDVLNSFSWSYNVHGTKEWTFFVPDSERTVTLLQTSGQCVFVPACWKHTVVNLEETLSINHNWITAANLDLCADCLRAEMKYIQVELDAWKVDDWSAHESMLRGCVGLDMTAFAFMVVLRLVELLQLDDMAHKIERDQLTYALGQLTSYPGIGLSQRIESTLLDSARATTILNIINSLLNS